MNREMDNKEISTSYWKDAFKRLRKNKLAMVGLYIILGLMVIAILAPWIAPYDPYEVNYDEYLKPPSLRHPLGTDEFGRDILSRIIFGARVSLQVGIIAEGIATAIGVLLGSISGYYGGWVDHLIVELTNIIFAFPFLLFVIAIVVSLGPSLTNLFIAVGITGWAGTARLIRGQILSLKESEYVEAARALGASNTRIIFKHIVPNCIAPIIISATLGMGGAIMTEASLSFLGLGAQPPIPSWGSMIDYAKDFLRTNLWYSFFPGLAIMITVFGFNLLGDGLRDALDPRLKV